MDGDVMSTDGLNDDQIQAIEDLQKLGISAEEAEDVVLGIEQYQAAKGEQGGGQLVTTDGRGVEKAAPQYDGNRRGADGKVDLLDWLMGKKILGRDFSAEDLIQAIVASEIPGDLLMPVVMAKTVDEVCDKDFTGSPTSVLIGNLMVCMIALNRKGRGEAVELYAVKSEIETETQMGDETY